MKSEGKLRGEDISSLVAKLTSALGNLSLLDNSEKLREDAICNGKAIVANWKPPTDEQINKIFFKMKKECLTSS